MEWKTSWGYEPIDYGKTIGWIEETACRMYVKNNLSGNRVKSDFQIVLEIRRFIFRRSGFQTGGERGRLRIRGEQR